jgi:hypothetical protein
MRATVECDNERSPGKTVAQDSRLEKVRGEPTHRSMCAGQQGHVSSKRTFKMKGKTKKWVEMQVTAISGDERKFRSNLSYFFNEA